MPKLSSDGIKGLREIMLKDKTALAALESKFGELFLRVPPSFPFVSTRVGSGPLQIDESQFIEGYSGSAIEHLLPESEL